MPILPPQLVRRAHLARQLDHIPDRPVTVIGAPAGAGKSVAVAQWCREHTTLPVNWLTPDHPERMVNELVELLAAGPPPDGPWWDGEDESLTVMARQRLPGLASAAAAQLIVIDGLDTPELATLAFEVAQAFVQSPGAARLVLVGRCPLPAELVSLRLDGSVWQVDARDLALTPAETAEVIHAYARRHVELPDPADTAQRLDGWMAGAVLAGLQHPGDTASADQLHEAALEAIESYVSTAVMRGLSDELRQFVAATSCVDELDPSLCDAIVGRDDSDQLLARLRAFGFPIVRGPMDGVRYLHPVRDALDAIARREDPTARAKALRSAADWYSRRQRPFEAAWCLVRLDAWHEVVTVITHHLPVILERDQVGRLADLVKVAPREVIRDQTVLALAGAWVLRMDGRVSAAAELLSVYWPYMTERARMIADVSRASVASWTDDMPAALAFAEAAVAACDALGDEAFDALDSPFPMSFGPANTDVFRALAHGAAQLACAYGGMWEDGKRHRVEMASDTAVKLPQIQTVSLYGARATYDVLSGRAVDGEIIAYAGLSVATQAELLDNRTAGDAWFALGEARRLTLRHDEAAEHLHRARQLADLNGRRNLRAACVAAEAHLAIDAGKLEEALALIGRLRNESPRRYPDTIAGLLAAAEARAYAAAGRFQAGRRVLDLAPLTSSVATARVMVMLGAGDVAGARLTVRDWPAETTVDATVRRAFAAAVICDKTGDPERTKLARAALAAAGPQRLLQPFVEFGAVAARLMRLSAVEDSPLVGELQRWLESSAPSWPRLHFTAREAMVMSHVADGHTLPDVAKAIHVSVNTVRSHVQAIYRKLGVDNRADAIRAWRSVSARENGSSAVNGHS